NVPRTTRPFTSSSGPHSFPYFRLNLQQSIPLVSCQGTHWFRRWCGCCSNCERRMGELDVKAHLA
ncbi:hypothetical protein V3C99_007692, partial [Haemonchus contortus]